MELPLCLRPVGMQVKAHPSSCIPKPLSWFVVLGCFFFLICWTWFYFFNVLVCIFNCVFPLKEVLLEMPS